VADLTAALKDFSSASWVATDIRLIRSNLHGEPRYAELGRWDLAASAD